MNGAPRAGLDTCIRAAPGVSALRRRVREQHQEAMVTEMAVSAVVQQSDCLVLVNPSAAAVNASVAREIEGWLSRRAPTGRTVWTQAPGHAAEPGPAHADPGLLIPAGRVGTGSAVGPGVARPPTLLPPPAR